MLVVLVLYFGVGVLLLRFGTEKHVVISGTLSSSVLVGRPFTFPSVKGHSLIARALGPGTSGCVAVFPGRHGPSPTYEAAVVPPLIQGGVKVYLIAYPGQLHEEGAASPNEIRDLARLAVIEIRKDCGQANVVLVGRSLGSMVAAYASREGRVVGLLLESTSALYSSAIRAQLRLRWYLRPMTLLPIARLLPEDYSLRDALENSHVPETVIFQGTDDEQTPINDLTRSNALPHGVTLVPVRDATHSNVFSLALPRYIETIFDMLDGSHEDEDIPDH